MCEIDNTTLRQLLNNTLDSILGSIYTKVNSQVDVGISVERIGSADDLAYTLVACSVWSAVMGDGADAGFMIRSQASKTISKEFN